MKKFLLSLILLCIFTGMMWSQTTTEIKLSNNGYVNEGAPAVTLGTYAGYDLQVKNATGFSRNAFVEFPLTDINPNATSIYLKIYLSGSLMTDFPTTDNLDQTPALVLGVNQINYSFDNTMTWSSKPTPSAANETNVATATMSNALKDTWVSIDVKSIAIAQKTAGQSFIRFRLFATGGVGQLLHFRQSVMNGSTISALGAYYPRLVQVVSSTTDTGLPTSNAHNAILYPSIASDQIIVAGKTAQVFDMQGKMILNEAVINNMLSISNLKNGIYIVKTEEGICRFIKQ
jgi:hypothetical protein